LYFSIQKNGDELNIGVKPFVDFIGDAQSFRDTVQDLADHGQSLDRVSVRLPQDNILVVSGMFIEKNISIKEKIPVIGDIPLLGFAFTEEKQELVRSELIIFLKSEVANLSKE
jgi:type II secretory pathway component GspD/PulD (secretin)